MYRWALTCSTLTDVALDDLWKNWQSSLVTLLNCLPLEMHDSENKASIFKFEWFESTDYYISHSCLPLMNGIGSIHMLGE